MTAANGQETRLTYRCVCGEAVPLSSANEDTLSCGKCDRSIQLSMIEDPDATFCATGIVSVGEIDDDELIGQTLGHFTIIERLGHGGMGAVYRALDEALQRYVAIKVIRGSTSGSVGSLGVQRLLEEARAQARVNHPNVVHIYYVSRSEEQPFFAMELIDGPTLGQLLESGPLPYPDIVRIARQTVAALAHSVKLGIVHGDIKPGNILMDGEQARLSDFGLARPTSPGKDAGLSGGTPSYMAPEICAGESATALSDQYSLGVMMFEMTFGRAPYTYNNQSLESRIDAHQHAEVEFPKPWPAEYPVQWKEVLKKLLAKKPQDRFADFTALDQRLAEVQPIEQPMAGRLLRSLAWMTDYLLFTALSGLVHLPLSMLEKLYTNQNGSLTPGVPTVLIYVLRVFVAVLIPYVIVRFHRRRGTSPGKKLFQVAVVDQHGLAPKRNELGIRSLVSFAPIWITALERALTNGSSVIQFSVASDEAAQPMPDILFVPVIAGVLVVAWTINVAMSFFGKRRLAWHDGFFKTKVVLAGSVEQSSSSKQS